ncbi:SpoIIE family protein phosphatase [Blastococcus sp. URHD0036]|uniref:SpoIIE family protein phosphatase n=1 Tax=Blastococcus sp. URHD0036 TaxID=1380356 RepID=UPI00068DDA74|nr:SpoIIE family protein phosphatase [Blastococcus sp. URHD0036]
MTDDTLRRSLFAAGGDLGEAMAARDWASTPLGPPETWPASLRNTVRILLTSRFAMWAGWGPELAFLYNDAYRRDTLQAKHPWALGRPAAEVWAEIWDDIGPRVRSVLDTGVATWDEDLLLFLERSGFPEETYHTFSYSPLGGDDGRTEGLLCVVTETTDQVIGERRMATLRDLSAALAPARTREQVLAAAGAQLLGNLADLPFSAVYLYDEDGTARVRATAGIDADQGVLPAVIGADDPRRARLRSELRAGDPVVVEGLAERLPDLPTGAWTRPVERAVVVPLTSTGQGPQDLAGFLVVGLNPHRPHDESYAGFLGLVGHQISSALVNADSYEAERERAEALAELDRAKTDFFSNVSHEFRTPLTLIMGPLADLRAAEDLSTARVREELEVVERNALRLGKLVNTLLEFSRLQAGRIDARFEPVDLAAATAELASVFRSAVARAGLAYDVDCAPLPEAVHVDRDMWEKVVLNLLSNALKHTFEGGITVRLRPGPGSAVLTVTDSGIGIPAAELPRLFERFTRVAGARSRSGEGSGIGLAMVKELVGLHGGTVTAESAPGAGTTFTVTVPLGTAHLPEDRLAPPTPDAPAVSRAATPFVAEALRWLPAADTGERAGDPAADDAPAAAPAGRVLVADDNADMRDYLVRLLAPRYAVTAVADGQEALDAARAAPPDLVVSDVMMPRLDGMALLAELRGDPRTSRVPVLLLSARAGEEAAVEGLAAGADDYLVKPFAAQELLARVGAHVHLGRARREAEERFTAIADLAPALIWVSDRDGRRVLVNAGWTAFTGRDAGAELDEGWRDGIHPDDRDRHRQAVAEAIAAERGWEVEFRLRRADGAYAWLLERAVPIGVGRAAAGYVGVCTDISVRHREAERLALLAQVGEALERERSVDGQLAALCRLLVDRRIADVCTARVTGEDGRLRFAGIAALDRESEAAVASTPPDVGIGPEAVRTGRTVTTDRVAWPPADRTDLGATLTVGSGMAVPLSVGGRVLAVLGMARLADSLPFGEDDRALVEEVAARAALAVDNVLLLAEERATARRLAVLQQVTAELSAATTPVEVAEVAAHTLNGLTPDGGRVGVYEVDPAQRALVALTMSGSADDVERAPWRVVPLTAPLALATAVTSGRPQWVETADERLAQRAGLTGGQVRSIVAAPLAAAAAVPLSVGGRVLGVLGIAYRGPHSFPESERGLLLAVAEQIGLALDRARLYRAELDIATTLQRSLLPAALPQLAGLALAAEYLPGAVGSSAGGDWYDVVELDEDRVAIAVGDVVGQGPAAAAVMGQLRSALSAALMQGCAPAEALELLDRFAARLPGALASSAACLVVDRTAGRVRWARAGHPPPLLVTGEGVTLLDGAGSGAVLGVPDRPPYSEGTAAVAPGTTLVLYTDGLVERRDEALDAGLARITAAAERHAAAEPGRLVRHLLADVLADNDRPDDVAVIAARVVPPPLAERLPADPARLSRIRRTVSAWTLAAGLPADSVDDLQLALGEALANAVEHAYAGSGHAGEAEYSLERDADGSVRVRVRDNGTWRPPPADKGFRGRGIELIRALAEDVGIGPAPGGGTEAVFRVVPPPAGEASTDPSADVPAADDGEAALAVRSGPAGPVLVLSGELDLAAVSRLRDDVLAAATRDGSPHDGAGTVLDLRAVSYLASAGVGLLLETAAAVRRAGSRLRLDTVPGSAPDRVLRMSGLPADLAGGGS